MGYDMHIVRAEDWAQLERDGLDVIIDPVVLRVGQFFLEGAPDSEPEQEQRWGVIESDLGALVEFFDLVVLRDRFPAFNWNDTYDERGSELNRKSGVNVVRASEPAASGPVVQRVRSWGGRRAGAGRPRTSTRVRRNSEPTVSKPYAPQRPRRGDDGPPTVVSRREISDRSPAKAGMRRLRNRPPTRSSRFDDRSRAASQPDGSRVGRKACRVVRQSDGPPRRDAPSTTNRRRPAKNSR